MLLGRILLRDTEITGEVVKRRYVPFERSELSPGKE